jgi:hypothetical protein
MHFLLANQTLTPEEHTPLQAPLCPLERLSQALRTGVQYEALKLLE